MRTGRCPHRVVVALRNCGIEFNGNFLLRKNRELDRVAVDRSGTQPVTCRPQLNALESSPQTSHSHQGWPVDFESGPVEGAAFLEVCAVIPWRNDVARRVGVHKGTPHDALISHLDLKQCRRRLTVRGGVDNRRDLCRGGINPSGSAADQS